MLFGYVIEQVNEYGLQSLREATLCVSPGVLRQIAEFLVASADEMESEPAIHPNWHRHLATWRSERSQFELPFDIVVAPETAG